MMSRFRSGAALGALFVHALLVSNAAEARLVRDINPTILAQAASSGRAWMPLGSNTLFVRDDATHGTELWITDGTPENTRLLRDIKPGAGSSEPMSFTPVGNLVYFTADDGINGRELWRTDGTTAGTRIVADINPGIGDGARGLVVGAPLTVMGGVLYFAGNADGLNSRLWRSDGTASGTYLLIDKLGEAPTLAGNPVAVGSRVFFPAYTATTGEELWSTDGTVAGTALVKDIKPGSAGAEPYKLVASSSGLYFTADDGTHGRELWFAESSGNGAHLVKDLSANGVDSWFANITTLGNDAVLLAATPNTRLLRIRSDGQVTELASFDSWPGDVEFLRLGNRLLFTQADSYEPKLWSTDGTAAGTRRLGTSRGLFASTGGAQAIDGTLYFFGRTGPAPGALSLWKTDGTDAGTVLYAGFPSNFTSGTIAAYGGRLYLGAYATQEPGTAMWVYEGTPAVAMPVADFDSGAANPGLSELRAVGGLLYFNANLPDGGAVPFVSNGTQAGTRSLSTATLPAPLTGSSSPHNAIALNNRLLFAADDGVHGIEPWISDGTEAGTRLLLDIRNDTQFPFGPMLFVPLGDQAIFTVDDGVHGAEPWVTDGTASGTRLLADIWPGRSTSTNIATSSDYVIVGGVFYFAANDNVHGPELWRSDGTPAGTRMVVDSMPGTDYGRIDRFTALGSDRLLFARQESTGLHWWISDGTAAGTQRLTNTVNVAYSPTATLNGAVYFVGNPTSTPQAALQLWRTDGTAAGTVQVSSPTTAFDFAGYGFLQATSQRVLFVGCKSPVPNDDRLYQPPDPTGPCDLYATNGIDAPLLVHPETPSGSNGVLFNDRLYFSTLNVDSRYVLRVSDGTTPGTRDLVQLSPSADGPIEIAVVEGQLLLSMDHPDLGPSLWRLDATGSGIKLVAGLDRISNTTGIASSLVGAGNDILFAADLSLDGRELHAVSANRPNAANDATNTAFNTPIDIPVTRNDGSFRHDIVPGSVLIESQPSRGSVSVLGDGRVRYQPESGYSGTDRFSYTVLDSAGQPSDPAQVSITVTASPGPSAGTAPIPEEPPPAEEEDKGSSGGGSLDGFVLLVLMGSALCRRRRIAASVVRR